MKPDMSGSFEYDTYEGSGLLMFAGKKTKVKKEMSHFYIGNNNSIIIKVYHTCIAHSALTNISANARAFFFSRRHSAKYWVK